MSTLTINYNGRDIELAPDPGCSECNGSPAYRLHNTQGQVRPCRCILRQLGIDPSRPTSLGLKLDGTFARPEPKVQTDLEPETDSKAARLLQKEEHRAKKEARAAEAAKTRAEEKAARLIEAEARLAAEQKALDSKLGPLNEKLASIDTRRSTAKQKRKQFVYEIDTRRVQIAANKSQIETLERSIRQLEVEIKDRHLSIASVDAEIDRCNDEEARERHSRNKIIARAEDRIAPLRATVERLRRQQ